MTAKEHNETALRDLETELRTELAVAEQADGAEQAEQADRVDQARPEPGWDAVADDERPPDPDGERYESRLRSLLGAVSALER